MRTDNDSGLFVTYPNIGALGQFNCLTFASLISAADELVRDLQTINSFSFLGDHLPLINLSISDILSFAGDLASFFTGLATGDADTINTLESDLKAFFGLPADSDLIDLSVQDTSPAATLGGTSGQSLTRFNPDGANNALVITARQAGAAWDGYYPPGR